MVDQRKSASSGNDINSMTDNDLYKLEVAESHLQSLQLNGERLVWTSDLDTLKKFVENRLNLQGKWTSPGGNSKQFKSSSKNLIITWYNRKQLTLAFQGPDGPYFKSKLVDLVLNKKARLDSSVLDSSSTTEQENSPLLEAENCYAKLRPKGAEGEAVNSSEEVVNPMIIADIEGLKFELLILQKKVESNTGLLSRLNRQSQDDLAVDAELYKYKERCDKLLSLITKKDREIEDLEEKYLLIENRSRSLEHENDSLRLALRLVAQDRSGDDSHQQDDGWRQVNHSRHRKAGRDARNGLKLSTAKTFVTRNRFEPSRDDEDVRNEIMHQINRGHSTTEVNSQDKKSKLNRSGKKTTKGNVPILRHMTVDDEQNVNNLEHREESNTSHTTIIAGDSILKHLNSHNMSKDNKKVKVATFPCCTIRDMRDHI